MSGRAKPPSAREPRLPSPPRPPNANGATADDAGVRRVPLWIALAAVLLGFAAGFVVTVIAELVGHAFGSSLTSPSPAVNIAANFLFDLCFVGAALYFTVLGGHRGWLEFGYRRIPWRKGIIGVLVAGGGYYLVSLLYASLVTIHGTDKLPTDLGVHQSTAAAIAAGVFVCLFAPICEEFFFRGFLFGILRQIRLRIAGHELGPWLAAVIVGLLFGLAHTGSAQPAYLVPLGLLGFVLCLLRWRTNSLYPGMVLHSLNNCVAFGVNELAWHTLPILGLCVASLAGLALLTGPFSRPRAAGTPSAS